MNSGIAIIFNRLGPYHQARLRAVARRRHLSVIEVTAKDEDYAWAEVPDDAAFERITLFGAAATAPYDQGNVRQRVWRALEHIRPTAVALPGWSDPASLAALLWCVRSQDRPTPAILMSNSTFSDFPRTTLKEMAKRQIVRSCSAALAGGAPQREYLAMLGMPQDRIFAGYAAVDNEYFSTNSDLARSQAGRLRLSLGLPVSYFLVCCRLIRKKNLARLLDAYSIYRRTVGSGAWDLLVVGDGPLRQTLQKQAIAAGIADHVYWPGFQQYDRLPAFYGLANALIHVSTSEQWGLVVNEAMAAGLPVLVSDRCGCARDLVREGANGFLFDPLDPGQIAEFMRLLTVRSFDLKRMGRESRAFIASHSVEQFAEGLARAVELGLREGPVRQSRIQDRLLLRLLASR